jgi:HSP20 family protein
MSTKLEEKINTNTLDSQKESQSLPKRERVYSPSVNLYETEKEAVFLFEIPGVEETNVDISLEKGILTVEAKVNREPTKGDSKNYFENQIDIYRRKFNLNKMVDVEKAVAKLENGQLHLTLPKEEPVRKKISIQAN